MNVWMAGKSVRYLNKAYHTQ